MEEITKSISEAIRKRAASATLGTYIFFWSSYHWQGIYVTFFVHQDYIFNKYGLLKNEYVNKHFFGIDRWNDSGFHLGFIIPGMLTYLFIWLVPDLVLIHAYKREQKHKVDKRIIKINEEKRITASEELLEKQRDKTLKAKIQVSDTKKEAVKKNPKIAYDEELEEIKVTKQMRHFEDVLRAIYEHKGNVYVPAELFGSDPVFELNPNSLRFADSRGLVKIVESGKRVELTDKGKYFASKFEGSL